LMFDVHIENLTLGITFQSYVLGLGSL
jgi:hypothetical protein